MNITRFVHRIAALGLAAGLAAGAFGQPAAPTEVYVAQLPSPTELISAASAHQMSVERIDQSNGQVTAVYRMANGQENTVRYLPLPANEAAAANGPAAVPTGGTTTVVYQNGPYYPYAYPWGWYAAPVAIGIGFGWGWGWHGGWGWHR